MSQKIEKHVQTSFSRAECQTCKAKFIFPYNSDMDCWKLYFYGKNGTCFGYYEALDDPIWEYTNNLLKKNFPEDFDSEDYNLGTRLQNVIAKCADKIENQELTADILCPQCHSKNLLLFHDELVEYGDIPRVSFEEFENYDKATKNYKIITLYKEYKDQYPLEIYKKSMVAKFFDFISSVLFMPIRWLYNLRGKNV